MRTRSLFYVRLRGRWYMMVESYTEKKPCRHCGTDTAQRAEGIPYCSMDCIGKRRREVEGTVLECPLPDCDWTEVYDPDSKLQRLLAHNQADVHRESHRPGGEGVNQ